MADSRREQAARERVARRLDSIDHRVTVLSRASQIAHSTVAVTDGDEGTVDMMVPAALSRGVKAGYDVDLVDRKLDEARDQLEQAQQELADRLTDAEVGVSGAAERLDAAEQSIADAQSALSDAGTRLSDAESDITDAFGQISDVSSDVDAVKSVAPELMRDPTFRDGFDDWVGSGGSFYYTAEEQDQLNQNMLLLGAVRDGDGLSLVVETVNRRGLTTRNLTKGLTYEATVDVYALQGASPLTITLGSNVSSQPDTSLTVTEAGKYKLRITGESNVSSQLSLLLEMATNGDNQVGVVKRVSLIDVTPVAVAQNAADQAQSTADSAASAAQDALSDAQDASDDAAAAQSAADAAQSAADTAQSAADQAGTDAATADAKAAQAAADAAQAIADAASAADDAADANQAALDAAGLAGSKGKVIYSGSEPTGPDADEQNLWIRTSDSKPHVWDGTQWVPVTDQAALDAASEASTARSEASSAQSTADQAVSDAATAQAKAEQAEQKADAAQSTADSAASAAQDAQQAADAADAKADQAKSDAADAAQDALDAAGIASGKGKVIYQKTAPSGSNADEQNLWIRTTDSKPHVWDGSKWVAVTDQAALDAAQDAADAYQAAQSAQSAADQADSKADQAQSAAGDASAHADAAMGAASAAQDAADRANAVAKQGELVLRTNYVRDAAMRDLASWYTYRVSVEAEVSGAPGGVKVVVNTTGVGYTPRIMSQQADTVEGDVWTFSALTVGTATADNLYAGIQFLDGQGGNLGFHWSAPVGDNVWGEITATAPAGAATLRGGMGMSTGSPVGTEAAFAAFQLEKGTERTSFFSADTEPHDDISYRESAEGFSEEAIVSDSLTVAQAAQAAADQASADADAKADAAEAAAKAYAEAQADAAEAAAKAAASGDAQDKADAAKAAAIAAAAQDAQAKADAAEAAAKAKAEDAQNAADSAASAAASAQAAADAAQSTADNLPKVLHGTTAPTGTAPDGSIWWMHDGSLSGNVVGQWNRDGGSWVKTPLDSEAIANLDVGKLTAGSAELATVVAQKIASATGQFIELDVDQLNVTGQANIKQVVAEAIASATAQFIELDVGQLTVSGSSTLAEAVIEKLWTDVVKSKLSVAEKLIASEAIVDTLVGKKITAPEIEGGIITGTEMRAGKFSTRQELAPDHYSGVWITPDRGVYVTAGESGDEITLKDGRATFKQGYIGDPKNHESEIAGGTFHTGRYKIAYGEPSNFIEAEARYGADKASFQRHKTSDTDDAELTVGIDPVAPSADGNLAGLIDATAAPGGLEIKGGSVLTIESTGILEFISSKNRGVTANGVRLDNATGGWIDLAYASGYSLGTAGQLSYMVSNGMVHIRGGASGSFGTGDYQTINADPIPKKYRPAQHYRTGTMGTGMRGYCGLEINADDGTIKLGWSRGSGSANLSAPSWISACCSYPLEP